MYFDNYLNKRTKELIKHTPLTVNEVIFNNLKTQHAILQLSYLNSMEEVPIEKRSNEKYLKQR